MIAFSTGLLGGYFLLGNLTTLPFRLGRHVLLPVLLLLFGLSLLLDAFKKPAKGSFRVTHNGDSGQPAEEFCREEGEAFRCTTRFGENTRQIRLARLAGGEAEVSFGELRVDLSQCGEIADGAVIRGKCSFGELVLMVPSGIRVETWVSTSVATVETEGSPAPDAAVTIRLEGSVSFGQITVRYI